MLNVVLTETLQMDCNERMWTGLLKRAQALPPSLVSAITKHAAPLLATDQSGQVSFSLGARGVIADNVAVSHVQDIRGVWRQRCEWVDGKKQGWCFERNDQGKTLTLYMKDNECNGYCLYKRNGDDQGVVDYVNGELFKKDDYSRDLYRCYNAPIGVRRDYAFYMDSRGIHLLGEGNELSGYVRKELQHNGLRRSVAGA